MVAFINRYNPLVFTYKTYEEMLDLLSIMVLDNVEPCEITYKMMVCPSHKMLFVWSECIYMNCVFVQLMMMYVWALVCRCVRSQKGVGVSTVR